MAIDVLFIHPGDHRKNYQELAREYTAVATPAWTLLLADAVRNAGRSVSIHDANVDGWDETAAADLLGAHDPRLVVLMVYGHHPSASTQTMPAAGRIVRALKAHDPDVPVALGGVHPSALPERTLREEQADFVIQGEGLPTILGLIDREHGRGDLRDIPGLWYRDDGEPRFTRPAPLVQDLDAVFSDYAWDLLPGLDRYRAHNMHCFQDFERSAAPDFADVRSPYVAMNTSLGCPFSCHYCCINAVFGRPGIRYWSLDTVMRWIDGLVRRGVRNIRFDDELFILSPERVEAFCDRIIERGYDLNIWVYGRVDTIRAPLLPKLRRAGITWICLGIEAGNEQVRSAVNKSIRRDIREVVRTIQANDISVLGNYMFGLPEDTPATMQETLDLVLDLNCEYANLYTVMAYPGSRLYDWAAGKDGWLPPGWEGFSQLGYLTQPLPTNHVSAREVLRFRDEAFRRCHGDPAYLSLVERRFGGKVRRHIERMLEIKLRRKLLEERP